MSRLKRVGFWPRFAAWIIDQLFVGFVVVLVILATMPLIIAATFTSSSYPMVAGIYMLMMVLWIPIAIALPLIYYVWMEGSRGQTLGKMALDIVVKTEKGKRIGYTEAFVRRIGLMIPIFGIVDGLCILGRRKQRIFDRVAKTIVVQK